MTVQRIAIENREQWLALRQRDLTASDIAAVAGVDPRRSPLRVYAEKTGRISATDDNAIMRRGRWLESAVVEALRDERPHWDIRRAGVYLRDPEIRMGGTPDAVAVDPGRPGIGNVQCKVVSRPIFERDWCPGELDEFRAPLKFQIQSLAEAILEDATWAVVAALVVDTYSADLVVVDVPRHAGAEERIRTTVRNFWADVGAGREPAPVYRIDGEIIAALYPEPVEGLTVDLTGDNRMPGLLARRARHKRFVKAAEEWIDGADAEIKHKIGDAEEARLPGWKITLKAQTRKEYLVPEKTFRTLRVTDKRQKELS